MKTKILLPGLQLLLLLYLISLTSLAQQPKLEWAQRWNGVGNVYETAMALAVDAEGNSYVTGSSRAVASTSGVTTIKYSPTGEELWVRLNDSLSSESRVSIAVDNKGGVYILSATQDRTDQDFGTIRYDAATGEQTWFSRYGSPGEYDVPSAIAIDSLGNIYVTGTSQDSSYLCENGTCFTTSFATVRYEATTGEEIWVSRYDRPQSSTNIAKDIAVDAEGGVYVIGTSVISETNNDIAIVRYEARTGAQTWASFYDGENSDLDQATDIAVDNKGSVYITGYSIGSDFLTTEAVTARYDAATGEQIWSKSYVGPNPSNDATAIAIDDSGGVYITGSSMDFLNLTSQYAIVRYDAATGEQSWISFYQDQEGSFDISTDIAVDNQGGVFVTGYSETFDPVNEVQNDDYVTLRYAAATGEQTWVSRYNSPPTFPNESPDLAFAIAIDNQGGVIVTGESLADFATVRYNASSGEELWVQRYNRTENVNDFSIAIAVDAEGNTYVTGTSNRRLPRITTVKYSPSGEELWVAQFEGGSRAIALAIDNKGGVYVTGVYFNDENFTLDYATIRYDAVTGKQTWTSSYNGPASNLDDRPKAIAVDSAGGVYVTGFSYNEDLTTDYATVRYDAATGEETWASRYSGPEGTSIDSAAAIAIDNQGGVYVTGVSAIDSTNTAFATVRYEASTGEESWTSRHGEASNTDVATAITTDQQGGIYVTGYSGSADAGFDYTSVRYDASTGEESWASSYNGSNSSDDRARAIAVDTAGGVYVTGTSSSGSDSDYATLRYDAATGEESWISRYDDSAGSRDSAAAIAVDNAGGVYVTGVSYVNQNADFATVRYDATTGEQVWAERYDSPYNQEDVAVDMALDGENNLIITGYSYSPETFYDFLTVKYSQCLALAKANITGSTNAAVSTSNSTYSISTTGVTSYTWSITDIDGNAYTDFRGQGTGTIAVDWPEEPNVYKISVASSAAGGCEAQTSVLYVHVYDPEAGSVSGGGWSDSPMNAEHELMRQGGMLYWGFVARFRNEERVQGSALVILDAGPTIFRSSSVEDGSLVISGNRAFFRGTGVLLHQRGLDTDTDDRQFGYLIAATDGHLGPNTSPDQLRLKIWVVKEDGTEGEVVYDNQVGCTSASLDDNAPACSAIDRGDIIISKPQSRSLSSALSQNAVVEPVLQGLQAYPTAVSDRTTLSFATERETAYTLELYDLKGALVQSIATGQTEAGKRYEHELSADGLSRGMYLIRLSTADKVHTVKVVVER